MADRPDGIRSNEAIETLRGLACVSLVWYHTVGSGGFGLGLARDHPLQVVTDLMVNVRMPLFALIAGYVYALRPVAADRLQQFCVGKIHRLLLPGAVAITVFLVLSSMVGTEFAMPFSESWRAYVFPYAHFWFLQAIFIILLGMGTLEALLGPRIFWWICAASVGLYFLVPQIPDVFALNRAAYLLPYFLCGVVLFRYRAAIAQRRAAVLWGLAAALFLTLSYVLWDFLREGEVAQRRQDLDSLVFGLSVTALLALTVSRIPLLVFIGSFSYMIYLYHPIATSGMRRALESAGVDSLSVKFVLGVAAGLLVPMAMELAARSTAPTMWLVLGRRAARRPAAGAPDRSSQSLASGATASESREQP